MSEVFIRYQSEGGIATITIDRPAKRNALSVDVCDQLASAWKRFAEGDDRIAILTASNDVAFTAGADLNNPPPRFWEAVPGVGIPLDKPVISAVSGLVIGAGILLVAMSDLCVAADNTRFYYPEARVGICAGMISTLAGRVPHKVAMELLLLGEMMSAQRAYEGGLINKVVPVGEHHAAARAWAETLMAQAPLVHRLLKRLVAETLPRSPVEIQYHVQRQVNALLASDDAKEGPAAFLAKRPPRFTGQ